MRGFSYIRDISEELLVVNLSQHVLQVTQNGQRVRTETVVVAVSYTHLKRSEFIGHIKRVSTVEEARAYIESVRKTYHDARHVCSAFIIGADRDIQRSSDDGEPAGTAGVPMMQALLARQTREDGTTDLSDVVAVVVRYFGGIKLGAGGLVRAYTDSVRCV